MLFWPKGSIILWPRWAILFGQKGQSRVAFPGVIARLKSEASKLRPGIIMVTIGTNGNNTEEKLKEMTDLILSIGARPILNHIPMMTSVSGTKTVNDMIDKVVASYGHGTVGCCRFDVATAVGNDPAQGQDTSLFISDLIHPNDAGHLCLMNQAKIDCPEIFQNILI